MFSSFIGAFFCTSDMTCADYWESVHLHREHRLHEFARADLRIPSNVVVTVVTLTFMDFLAVPPVKHDD